MMERCTSFDYKDILDLSRPEPWGRKRMGRINRAAQFASFAALSGHEEAISETARLTQRRMVLDEEEREALDRKLQVIRASLNRETKITVTYFVEDPLKAGGTYHQLSGRVEKIDAYARCLVMEAGARLWADDIYAIESPLFSEH